MKGRRIVHFKSSLLIIWMAVSIVAHAQINQDDSNNKTDFNDPAKPIVVQKTQPEFTVRLKSNPTTGYSWFLKTYDAKYLKPIDHKFIPPQRRMPGAAGYQEWVFAATPAAFKQTITTHVRLVYRRPWEKKTVQDVTFKVIAK